MRKTLNSDAQIRAWLEVRISAFLPRIKRRKKTKAAPYSFSLAELGGDLHRTLKEFEDRFDKQKKGL